MLEKLEKLTRLPKGIFRLWFVCLVPWTVFLFAFLIVEEISGDDVTVFFALGLVWVLVSFTPVVLFHIVRWIIEGFLSKEPKD